MKRIFLIVLISAAVLLNTATKSNAALPQNSHMSIADTLYYSGQFNSFSDLLERANLNKVLKGRGPYTVFAVPDSALSCASHGMVQRLASVGNECQLNRTMKYHIIDKSLSCNQISCAHSLKTKDGSCISVCPGCNALKVDNSNIVQTIYANNGVIHVVDNLLLPNQEISLR